MHNYECIRFNTNDIACWSETTCSCGRTYRMIKGGVQGRVDHIMKVRGTFINPATIEDVINKYPKCTQEYQIIVHEDNSHITVNVEAADGISRETYMDVARELSKRIQKAIFVKLDVVIMPHGAMVRGEGKSKRIIDLRKGDRE